MQKYYANGKLLLTGEYLVLDGALAIALPTKLGQSLTVESNQIQKLVWESQDSKSYPWFQHIYTHLHQKIDNNPIAERLRVILLHPDKHALPPHAHDDDWASGPGRRAGHAHPPHRPQLRKPLPPVARVCQHAKLGPGR